MICLKRVLKEINFIILYFLVAGHIQIALFVKLQRSYLTKVFILVVTLEILWLINYKFSG